MVKELETPDMQAHRIKTCVDAVFESWRDGH